MNRRRRRSVHTAALALGLGRAPERREVVHLDAVEVVLGLGVGRAEHRVGVGLAVNVGDAVIVAGYGHRSYFRRDVGGLFE